MMKLKNQDLMQWFKWLSVILLAAAWFLYEGINWVTTFDSLEAMFGAGAWITTLTLAVVLSDLGALGRVFSEQQKLTKDNLLSWQNIVFVIWIIVTLTDLTLNWYFLALKMEAHQVQAPASIEKYATFFPVAIGFLIWAVQIGIVYGATVGIASQTHMGVFRRTPSSGGPRPSPSIPAPSGLSPMRWKSASGSPTPKSGDPHDPPSRPAL